jgi:hypothetical protein
MIQDEFLKINKQIDKSKALIVTHGLPLFYIKMLAEVEDHIVVSLKDKDLVKKMKPFMKQLRIQVRKHNDNYRSEITDFRNNPWKYETNITVSFASNVLC